MDADRLMPIVGNLRAVTILGIKMLQLLLNKMQILIAILPGASLQYILSSLESLGRGSIVIVIFMYL